MKAGFHASVILVLGLFSWADPPSASSAPQNRKPVVDLAKVDPASLGVEPVPAEEDPRTGFVVGGKNPTALIRTLTEINGRTIAELEEDMRPGAASRAGFLGEDEGLLDVMAADNESVVDELGLTHQELARHMLILAEIGRRDGAEPVQFRYRGRRFRVRVDSYMGFQPSPFQDGTKTNSDAIVRNLDNGEQIRYSLLVPQMVERYGFYEGEGTSYRVEPRKALKVLDFLKGKQR